MSSRELHETNEADLSLSLSLSPPSSVEYVTCKTCKSPDTLLAKENRIFFMNCQACGSRVRLLLSSFLLSLSFSPVPSQRPKLTSSLSNLVLWIPLAFGPPHPNRFQGSDRTKKGSEDRLNDSPPPSSRFVAFSAGLGRSYYIHKRFISFHLSLSLLVRSRSCSRARLKVKSRNEKRER